MLFIVLLWRVLQLHKWLRPFFNHQRVCKRHNKQHFYQNIFEKSSITPVWTSFRCTLPKISQPSNISWRQCRGPKTCRNTPRVHPQQFRPRIHLSHTTPHQNHQRKRNHWRNFYLTLIVFAVSCICVQLQDWLFDFLKKWFAVWKGMLISGEIAHCTLYFPVSSLSAVGLQGIQETVENAMGRVDKPEILIVVLPKCSFKSYQRQNLSTQIKLMPVKLPEAIWSPRKQFFSKVLSVLWSMFCCRKTKFSLVDFSKRFHLLHNAAGAHFKLFKTGFFERHHRSVNTSKQTKWSGSQTEPFSGEFWGRQSNNWRFGCLYPRWHVPHYNFHLWSASLLDGQHFIWAFIRNGTHSFCFAKRGAKIPGNYPTGGHKNPPLTNDFTKRQHSGLHQWTKQFSYSVRQSRKRECETDSLDTVDDSSFHSESLHAKVRFFARYFVFGYAWHDVGVGRWGYSEFVGFSECLLED